MARIPDTEIERLKQETDFVALVRSYGVELKGTGKNLKAICPLPGHDDTDPSFIVTPSKNLWKCQGCNRGGTVIDFVMHMDNVDFRPAVSTLLKLSPGSPVLSEAGKGNAGQATPKPVRQSPAPDLSESGLSSAGGHQEPVRQHFIDTHQKYLQDAVKHYHWRLPDHKKAVEYLAKRKLDDLELWNTFNIGMCDDTFTRDMPHWNKPEGKAIRLRYKDCGIIGNAKHHQQHFRGCITFPIINNGRVVQIYGRKATAYTQAHQNGKHFYLAAPQRGVWNLDAFKTDEIILCESIIDALSFWKCGFKNVTSAYGINGVTDDLMNTFSQQRTRRVYVAYDADKAGDAAAIALAVKLSNVGIETQRVRFHEECDANDMLVNSDDPEEMFEKLIDQAERLRAASKHVSKRKGRDEVANIQPVFDPDEVVIPDNPDDIELSFGDRTWRIKGLAKNIKPDVLKVTLRATYRDFFHLDAVDLISDKQRDHFVRRAEVETGLKREVLSRDLGHVINRIETIRDALLAQEQGTDNAEVELTPNEREAAMELLTAPDLIGRILSDYEAAGIVGEETNKLIGYLAATSRKLGQPLAVVIQSASSAGKTSLMEAVLRLMPKESQVKYSTMTGQSLYYMEENGLQHKILAIVEEEGAQKTSYALKLLQSEGELTIASTTTDPKTGKRATDTYTVKGPVMIFLTTTSAEVDEELLNRCLVLTVNESREQTRLIHQMQRKSRTLEGKMMKRKQERVRVLHQNAQRLLEPMEVMNNYAEGLSFIDTQTRTRRDNEKYLTLIDTIALLHQFQRPTKTNIEEDTGEEVVYIEVEPSDIELATQLMGPLINCCLDELPPQTRKLFTMIETMVAEVCEDNDCEAKDFLFSRRELREYSNWGDTQLKVHLSRLVDMEYLLIHSGKNGRFEYELVTWIGPTLMNRSGLDLDRSGQIVNWSGAVGPRSGGGRGASAPLQPSSDAGLEQTGRINGEKAPLEPKNGVPKTGKSQVTLFPGFDDSRMPL